MFPFLPRKIAQSSKTVRAPAASNRPTTIPQTPVTQENIQNASDSQAKGKGKEKVEDNSLSEDDYAILVMLSLSDHIIWADADLRRTITSGDEGYIPLRYLMRHSPFLSNLTPSPVEAVLAKAIRTHTSDHLDVRMLVSEPSRSSWRGKDTTEDDVGGFEVRRKTWRTVLQVARNYARHEWESRTIYMENIPFQHRSIAGIYRFTESLLAASSSYSGTAQPVQSILLPPHRQDKPGDQPKCKGFAIVIFLHLESAELLLSQWPWSPRRLDERGVKHVQEVGEAVKFGFRTLRKTQWDRLKEEYLLYRQMLLDEIAQVEVHEQPTVEVHAQPQFFDTADNTLSEAPASPMHSAPYPQGCLVFVRNVHPETNKTTLRTLFSQAFLGSSSGMDQLDYVDFNKGMKTCYLRLTTPHHTEVLTKFFAINPKIQSLGLDSSGTDASAMNKDKTIAMEVVDGTREELYWTKVPEKVRRQAVEKAFAKALPHEGTDATGEYHDASEQTEVKRKRKRGKHNG
ncbi:hypothetical protein BKA93DRAFT_730353 [Sparassis latifolia]|uniref:XRRM domain-containing protein n=1 Tax=Sparassis crispa TaxID=139825 RepID=A0A401GCZ3_9APHY|nr:hypothetical protein SCP_0212560 [Sparassis crispa]GBE80054.1 hypothetical protein SCP_0212560 [Sparassis crispa]